MLQLRAVASHSARRSVNGLPPFHFGFRIFFRADSFIHSLILGLWWMLTINFAINYSRTLTTKICFKD